MMLKLKLQYFGHLMRRVDSLGKTDAGRDWGQEKGTTEDEMAGWHHWLDGRESEWTPGVGDGQGGLAERLNSSSCPHPYGPMNREQICYQNAGRAESHEKRSCPVSYSGRSPGLQQIPEKKSKNRKKYQLPFPTSASWIRPYKTRLQGVVRQSARVISPMASKQTKSGFWLEKSKIPSTYILQRKTEGY